MRTTTTEIGDRVSAAAGRLALTMPLLTVPLLAYLGLVDRGRARLRQGGRDVGASVVEWVLIIAVVIGIVGAVAFLIRGKLVDKANELDLSTP